MSAAEAEQAARGSLGAAYEPRREHEPGRERKAAERERQPVPRSVAVVDRGPGAGLDAEAGEPVEPLDDGAPAAARIDDEHAVAGGGDGPDDEHGDAEH